MGEMAESLRRITRPRVGRLAYPLLLVMLLSLGGAVRVADLLPLTSFVYPVLLAGFALGLVVSASRLRAVNAIGLAALLGSAVVICAIAVEYGRAAGLIGRLLALRTDLLGWTASLLSGAWPSAVSPAALLLGSALWATGFIAARAVFRLSGAA